jgi:hypothetical protein
MLTKTLAQSHTGFGWSNDTPRDIRARAIVAKLDADVEEVFARARAKLAADVEANLAQTARCRARLDALLARPPVRRATKTKLASRGGVRRIMCASF